MRPQQATLDIFHNSKPIEMGASFSTCRTWRYSLWRIWDKSLPLLAFIGLNPSKADEKTDDHTIRRCISFAKAWGYGSIYMVNLFAFRATDPAEMKKAADPIGPENDVFLRMAHEEATRSVACWGIHGTFMNRDKAVSEMLEGLYCMGYTQAGHPKHPARLRRDTYLVSWEGIAK